MHGLAYTTMRRRNMRLELRAEMSGERVGGMLRPFPPHAFVFGLTSVHWREAWKYGERAFRYCHHDVGHAIGTARIAASTLGWQAVLLDGCDQNTVARLLGTQRAEDLHGGEPSIRIVSWPYGQALQDPQPFRCPAYFLIQRRSRRMVKTTWVGKANRLSHDHGVHWDIIDTAAESTWKTQANEVTIELERSRTSSRQDSVGERTMCRQGR